MVPEVYALGLPSMVAARAAQGNDSSAKEPWEDEALLH